MNLLIRGLRLFESKVRNETQVKRCKKLHWSMLFFTYRVAGCCLTAGCFVFAPVLCLYPIRCAEMLHSRQTHHVLLHDFHFTRFSCTFKLTPQQYVLSCARTKINLNICSCLGSVSAQVFKCITFSRLLLTHPHVDLKLLTRRLISTNMYQLNPTARNNHSTPEMLTTCLMWSV